VYIPLNEDNVYFLDKSVFYFNAFRLWTKRSGIAAERECELFEVKTIRFAQRMQGCNLNFEVLDGGYNTVKFEGFVSRFLENLSRKAVTNWTIIVDNCTIFD
jgi:hypothetical protein